MKRRAAARLTLTLGSALSFAAIAIGVAAPPGASGNPTISLYAQGHPFGIGEQQVYLIDRESILTVRYRDHGGSLRSKSFHYRAQTSVAWTIEGLSSAGGPVLGVATAAPTATGSAVPATNAPTVQSSAQSPAPSPTLNPQGQTAAAPGSALAEFAPASVVLSGIGPDLEVGKPWKSAGQVLLPFGTMSIALDNVIATPSGGQDLNMLQINSTGTSGFAAKVNVGGFGVATLRGGGTATATSYLETQNRLLLGTSMAAASQGNATANSRGNVDGATSVAPANHGAYEISVKISMKLVKYVPGIVPYTGPAGFVPASSYLGETTAPDTQIYSTTLPDRIAVPAATDTGFIPPPAFATPYQSALPEMSLPPVPLPWPSAQAAASPPAGPTPTPQPTHY